MKPISKIFLLTVVAILTTVAACKKDFLSDNATNNLSENELGGGQLGQL